MRYKSILKYLLLSSLVLVVISQALLLVLPVIVETLIVETLIREKILGESPIQKGLSGNLPQGLVLSDLGFKIEKIGIHHALVTRVSMGDGLSADFVEFQYHLKNLKRFQLEKIIISGLKISGQIDADNRLRFNGAVFPGKSNVSKQSGTSGDANYAKSDFFSGFVPEQVVLKDASLLLTTPSHEILIPFEILASLDTPQNKAVVNASFHPLGQTVKTIISGDFYSGIEFMRLEARSFHPDVLSGFLPEFEGFGFSGPVDIDILKKPETDWELSLSQLNLDLPGPSNLPEFTGARIKNFTASVGTSAGMLAARGGFDLSVSPVPVMGILFDLKLQKIIDSSPFFDLTLKNKQIKNKQKGRKGVEIGLAGGSAKITLQQPHLLFKLKGDQVRQTGQILFDCQNLMTTQGNGEMFIKNIVLKSGIKGDFSEGGRGLEFDIQSDLSRIKLVSKTGNAEFVSVNLSGNGGVTKQFDPLVRLDVRLKNGKMELPELKVAASGINARLPLVFPFKKEKTKGFFSIRELGYDNTLTATLRGDISQNEILGVILGGEAVIAGLDGFNLIFEGSAGGANPANPSARINFHSDPFLLRSGHLEKIVPEISLSADSILQFSSKGTIEYKENNLKSQASLMVDLGHLSFLDMNLALSGVSGAIHLNDLVVPESLPGQVLTVDKVTAGQFGFDKAKLRFSIEDGESLNIENLRFNWCNGLVSTESVRLPGKDNVFSLIFYCDRLELSDLLKQMGAFHAEGEGTLSGRIPVVYSRGNISFDKGFLFSTPGKGGRVVIENTQDLIAGIPMDSPEFVQLDLAREALKDFDYKWAKLELNTFEDTLYMNMELDGKPARLMPFEYKKEVGSFIRVDASSPGSRFQGIKLDVNLKLPFNQVLKFGNKLKTIFN